MIEARCAECGMLWRVDSRRAAHAFMRHVSACAMDVQDMALDLVAETTSYLRTVAS